MKRLFSLLLCAVLAFALCACAPAEEKTPAELAAEANETAVTLTAGETGPVFPAPQTFEGFAFRGYFTEPNGAGERVTPASEGVTVAYPYYTAQKEEHGVFFGCYTPFPYNEIVCEDQVRMLKDFGMNQILLDHHNESEPELHQNFLDIVRWLEQYDIKFMIFDGDLTGASTKEQALEACKDYVNSPSFECIFLRDEPGFGDLPGLSERVAFLRSVLPDIDVHIDLVNLGLCSRQFLPTYYNYFVNHFDTNHICTDLYAYGGDTDDILYDYYYVGFPMVAKASRNMDVPLWTYVLTAGDFGDPYRDMKFGLYGNLLFGGRGLLFFHYSYGSPVTKSNFIRITHNTMFCDDLSRAPVWYETQKLIREIRYFDDVYDNYTWTTAGTVYDKADETVTLAVQWGDPYKGKMVQDLTLNNGAVIAEYEETNGDGAALMIFNACSIPQRETETLRFRLPGVQSATMYMDETTTTLTPDESGFYTLTLEGTQAAFITVEYYN